MGYLDHYENNIIGKLSLNSAFAERDRIIAPDDSSASLRMNGSITEYLIENGKVVTGKDGNPVIKNIVSASEANSLVRARKLDPFE